MRAPPQGPDDLLGRETAPRLMESFRRSCVCALSAYAATYGRQQLLRLRSSVRCNGTPMRTRASLKMGLGSAGPLLTEHF